MRDQPAEPNPTRSKTRFAAAGSAIVIALICHPIWVLWADPGSMAEPSPVTSEQEFERLSAADNDSKGSAIPPVPAACANAIVDDDGTVETGYSWVPSVVEGIYVQEYASQEVASGTLGTVCVCWLRTRMDDSIDFEVVVYGFNSAEGMPKKLPFAAVPAHLSGVPMGVPGATFTAVDLGSVAVPEGPFFVGVRWDASADQYFFTCVDKTDRPEPPTRVFFRDDRSPAGWGASDETNDSTFLNHQAMFVRPVPGPEIPVAAIQDIPLGEATHTALITAILLAGVLLARRTRG